MNNLITAQDIEALACGATVLGSGGGGSPTYSKSIAQQALERYGPVKLLSCDQLRDDDLIMPVSMMGAPLVALERIESGKELPALYKEVSRIMGKSPTVLMASEIGGSNIFTPLALAAQLQIPILDADFIGRAFPELHMSSAELIGLPATPAVLADVFGNTVTFNTKDGKTLERIARAATVAVGSDAAVTIYVMTGAQAKNNAVISGSFSRAKKIGKTILSARTCQQDVINVLIKETSGVLLGSGVITDINQTITDGFLQGSVTLCNDHESIIIDYQNEYLVVRVNNITCVTTPDIITILEQDTGTPVQSESLTYGIRACVVAFPAPAIWQTSAGLALVGPRAFNYDFDYKSIST